MRRPIRLTVIAATPAACAILSILGLVALRGGGQTSLGSVTLLAAAGYDRQADRVIEAQTPSPAALREAASLSRRAIAQYPYDTRSWARLAYVDRMEHGSLTPAGVAALQRSYDLVGVDPDIGLWRIRFALENSQAIPKALRASVHEEVTALWTYWGDRSRIIDLQPELENPAGRLSLALWINQLQMRAAK